MLATICDVVYRRQPIFDSRLCWALLAAARGSRIDVLCRPGAGDPGAVLAALLGPGLVSRSSAGCYACGVGRLKHALWS